jgi:hypothetical protein
MSQTDQLHRIVVRTGTEFRFRPCVLEPGSEMAPATLFLFLILFSFTSEINGKKMKKFKITKPKVECLVTNYTSLDPVTLANKAVEEIFVQGLVDETIKCLEYSLQSIENGLYQLPDGAAQSIEDNLNTIRRILAPYSPDNRRLYHSPWNSAFPFPLNSSDPLPPAVDNSILYWDDAMTSQQCEEIIYLFNNSKLFQGNTLSGGKAVIDVQRKKTWEFDVSGTSPDSRDWWEVDKFAVSLTIKYLSLYQEKNPIFRSINNPLGDEGFRMKRYINDGTEHHGYHIDSGQEPTCQPSRILAILIYLNDVEEGGETVFYNQGISIKPKCGRVTIFPTSFTHVHAGRRPVSNPKYVLADMITL